MSIGYENILIGVGDQFVKTVTGGTFELGGREEAQVFSNPSAYDVVKALQKENPDIEFAILNADVI